MNKSIYLFFITNIGIICLLLFNACCKEKPHVPIYLNDIYQCYNSATWDSLKVKNAVIGEWNWEYISCENGGNNSQFKGLSIEFKPNMDLNIKQNGKIIQTSKWLLTKGNDDFHYGINAFPLVDPMYGTFLICNDIIEYNLSYVDGCDNYFRRK